MLAPLIQYWHDANPPAEVVETLTSFRERNPEMRQLVFDRPSAEEFIETHLGAREAAAFRACAVPAMQADYFRYCAIHAIGGIYADANFRCLDSLKGLCDRPWAGFLFGRPDPLPPMLASMCGWRQPVGPFRIVTNGMFGFMPAGHPLPRLAVQAATANIERRVGEGPVGLWVSTGPGVLTSLYLLHELGSVDAFLDYAAGTVIESSARLLGELIEDYVQFADMWGSVDILPLAERDRWGTKAGRHVSDPHWMRFQGSIYR